MQGSKEKSEDILKNFFELNKSENITSQNLGDAEKATECLKGDL